MKTVTFPQNMKNIYGKLRNTQETEEDQTKIIEQFNVFLYKQLERNHTNK